MRGVVCTCFLPSSSPFDRSNAVSTQKDRFQRPSSYRVVRPRSPTSPRQLDPVDPQLVRSLRLFLANAASRPPGYSLELEEVVSKKLEISSDLGERLREGLAAQQQCLTDAQLSEVEAGLDKMLQLFSSAEVVHLLEQQPRLIAAPLASWLDFFEVYGFTTSQTKNIISQMPEVLVKGSLVTAGAAIIHLKQLGFDNDEVRHRVVAYCPQVLMMETADIDTLISLWSKFQVGVDERAGM